MTRPNARTEKSQHRIGHAHLVRQGNGRTRRSAGKSRDVASRGRHPPGRTGSQWTPRWRKTDSNCRSPLRRGAFLNRLLPPLQPAKPVETEVFDPRGTDGSNPSSSSGESMPNLFELEDVGPRSHQAEKREPIRPPPEAPAYWDLSGGGHTPATACSGSAVQAGSSKTLFGRP